MRRSIRCDVRCLQPLCQHGGAQNIPYLRSGGMERIKQLEHAARDHAKTTGHEVEIIRTEISVYNPAQAYR